MPDRSRLPQPKIVLKRPASPSGERGQTAAEIAAAMNTAGMPAAVISTDAALADFMQEQATQVLELARQCKFPDVRAELEKMARDCLLKVEAIRRKQ